MKYKYMLPLGFFTYIVIACVMFQPGPTGLSTSAPTVQQPQPATEAEKPQPTLLEPSLAPPVVAPSDVPMVEPDTEFDLSSANQIPPDDILGEITYYGSGALPCPDYPYSPPTITYSPQLTLLMPGYLVVCGWPTGENLSGSIEYPDGRVIPGILQTDEYGPGESLAWLSYTPQIDDPEGAYIFRMEGDPFEFMSTTYYYRPDEPRLLLQNEYQILFYGFTSQEQVRLFCYDVNTYTLLGWKEYQVDDNGQLTLDVPADRCNFAAVGPQSGEVYMLIDMFPIGPLSWTSTSIMR